ncbi:MAG: thymidylate synthase (FAD) [Deltaproteobacteria bacterium CG11_big_fil_rev_8_21_14_0_20_47_16]|nr:MAG: thymidylate synthase (FAD) [Deltaproteobacteria bacterium CG11_big_fil_rev_8_21_14_0_20_47_16]
MSEIEPESHTPPANTDDNSIRCLDHGFVRLVDVMGNDQSIVQSARVSYGKGTKNVRADRGLIRYLMKHQHTTPFEMVEFKFHVKCPIFVARQWIRHRTANVNEISGRYSVMEDTFWEPRPEDFRLQGSSNRQGSSSESVDNSKSSELSEQFKADQRLLYKHYEEAIAAGTAREVARVNLPLSLYTEWYWKCDLHNLLHFLRLRMDAHAQLEIRVFADAMATFVKQYCPIAWEAFEEFSLNAAKLACSERNLISQLLTEHKLWDELEKRRTAQLQEDGASESTVRREIEELCQTLNKE